MSTTVVNQPNSQAAPMSLKGVMAKVGQGGGDKQVIVLSVLAVVAALLIVAVLWSAGENMQPLYGNQEGFDSAQIIEVLEGEQISYQIAANTGQVLVAASEVSRARLLLAAKGVKAQLPMGIENLQSDITTSQFMEQARYRHGMEGELARTIMALDAVRMARVHLAIPKRTLFIRKQDAQVSASVMVDLKPGHNLSRSQVAAVVNLVSGSVPGLEAERVQLVTQTGELLSGSTNDEFGMAGLNDQQIEFTANLEQQLKSRAESMLSPVVGDGQYRVQLSAKVNFDRVEETQEQVDPSVVMTQERSSTQTIEGNMALGIPGALSNQPPQQNQPTNQSNNSTEELSRSFDTGRSVRHTQYQQAQLEQLSVSLLINQDAGDWQQPQLDQMVQMVKDAIGFDGQRGDQISISVFTFAQATVPVIEATPWWQMPEYHQYLRYGLGALVAICLILFVLRPLVTHLVTVERKTAAENSTPGAAPVALPEPEIEPEQEPEQPALASAIVALGLPEPGSPLTVQLEHLGMLANEEPARVAEVISQWIGADKRD
ncbi:flagellar basal-body MS-ring/collar protein FliF [Ferrimonas aestuarii]|uniref:Flagellar M-ring protein n=1 Tax=Ferrimonas aestuarii TaxID=2569539 RepID=A0A4U1BM76_9GAMM|nr:flagellar basal-body MS-ring/collar protein FliF [Ferrimonas aestuarii]TKB54571.1 flagellar M-ring protein FliF [Ferrimonas aestuarii]